MFRALNFHSDRLRTKRTKFGPHKNFPLYTACYKAGSLLRHEIRAIRNKRALFPYNDSCHVNYSAHKLSEFPSPCSNFNFCRTLWVTVLVVSNGRTPACTYMYLTNLFAHYFYLYMRHRLVRHSLFESWQL